MLHYNLPIALQFNEISLSETRFVSLLASKYKITNLMYKHLFLFFCFFSSFSPISHSYWSVTITGKGLQNLTYTGHSWSLSSEGSLACNTYCDTRHPFIWSSTRTHDPYIFCRAFGSGAVTTFLNDVCLSYIHRAAVIWLKYCRYGVKP